MDQAASLITAFAHCCECECCSDFSKYVLNASRCSSKCCNCLELDIETDAISLASENSSEELEVEGCVKWHKR